MIFIHVISNMIDLNSNDVAACSASVSSAVIRVLVSGS